MGIKKFMRKCSKYLLGIAVLTGGFIANMMNNTSPVSAYSSGYMYVFQAKNMSDSIYYGNVITALAHNAYDSYFTDTNCIYLTTRVTFNANVNWNFSDKFYINIDNVDFDNLDSFTYENNIEAVKSSSSSSSSSDFSYTAVYLYSNNIVGAENIVNTWNNIDIFPFIDKYMLEIGRNAYEVQGEVEEGFVLELDYDMSNDLLSDVTIGKLSVNNSTGGYSYSSKFSQGGSGYSLQGMRAAGDVDFNFFKMSYSDLGDYVLGEITQEDIDNARQEGYEEGANSVDITKDNEDAINEYVSSNNMKTEEQYNAYGESKFEEGVNSVDITKDNEEAINEYITSNNMKTEEEYLTYGEEKYTEGKEESANEYAEKLNELDTTINNLNTEINELNSKINDYESTDDKYQVGYETGYNAGHSAGYQEGYNEALSEDIESYGEEQYQKGYNSGYSVGYSTGYSTAQAEKDEEIEDVEEEKNSLVEQVESLQNDITNLNNRINTLTGTINNMNELIDTKYQEGFDDGVESVDITSDNETVYQKGYEDGYLQCEIDNPPSVTFPENTYDFGFKDGYANGYREGAESIDITSDNQQAIEDYINNENMKTEEEYLSYGEEKYSLGYKDNAFGKQVKRLGSNIGTFFVNIGKGIVQYVAFGWAWDKSGKFMPNF